MSQVRTHLPDSAGNWELPSAVTQFVRLGGAVAAGAALAIASPCSKRGLLPVSVLADGAGAAADATGANASAVVAGAGATCAAVSVVAAGANAVDFRAVERDGDALSSGAGGLPGSRCEQRVTKRRFGAP